MTYWKVTYLFYFIFLTGCSNFKTSSDLKDGAILYDGEDFDLYLISKTLDCDTVSIRLESKKYSSNQFRLAFTNGKILPQSNPGYIYQIVANCSFDLHNLIVCVKEKDVIKKLAVIDLDFHY